MIKEYRRSIFLRGEKLSIEQLPLLDAYCEFELDPGSGQVKVRRNVAHGHVVFIKYYLDGPEDEASVASGLSQLLDRFAIATRQSWGAYIIESERDYADGVVIFHSRYLIDADGMAICWELLDLETGQPDYTQTRKYAFDFDYNKAGDDVLEGHYNADGSLEYIMYMPPGYDSEQDYEAFTLETFDGLNNWFGGWDMLPYYRTAKLEP